MKVVTDELVENATHEIKRCTANQDISYLKILRNHWLLRPGTDDIAGEKIIKQLRESLLRIYGANLPQILQQILLLLENKSLLVIGYIRCNVMALDNFNS